MTSLFFFSNSDLYCSFMSHIIFLLSSARFETLYYRFHRTRSHISCHAFIAWGGMLFLSWMLLGMCSDSNHVLSSLLCESSFPEHSDKDAASHLI